METTVITIEQSRDSQTMTSIEIATLIGKPHNDLMKAIRKMEPAWQQEHQGNFSQMQIREPLPNGGYRMRPCFLLTKAESLFVATKFNDVARARLVLRWAELETSAQKVQAPIAMLETEAEILQRGDEIRRQQIEKENAPSDGCFTTSEIAKELGTTVRELNKLLVKEGVIYRQDGRFMLTPEFEDKGYCKDRAFHYFGLEGEKKERLYLVWTPKGAEYVKCLYFLTTV